jgi:hypothetical protein
MMLIEGVPFAVGLLMLAVLAYFMAVEAPSPSQILSSIEGERRVPAPDTLRVQTTAMTQILGYQRTVRSQRQLSIMKITRDLELA